MELPAAGDEAPASEAIFRLQLCSGRVFYGTASLQEIKAGCAVLEDQQSRVGCLRQRQSSTNHGQVAHQQRIKLVQAVRQHTWYLLTYQYSPTAPWSPRPHRTLSSKEGKTLKMKPNRLS